MKVLQKAGTGGKSSCAVGDAVQVPYAGWHVCSGKIHEDQRRVLRDGFVRVRIHRMEQVLGRQARLGWNVRCCTAPRQRAAARAAAAGPQPPRAGLTSCAGKIEGRYSSAAGSVV
jgi:hypothetical protein